MHWLKNCYICFTSSLYMLYPQNLILRLNVMFDFICMSFVAKMLTVCLLYPAPI